MSPPPSPSPPPAISGEANLTTCLYKTNLGVFYVTWARTFFGHSVNLFLHSQDCYPHSSAASPLSLSASAADLSLSSAVSFRLHLNPLAFWRRRGSKRVSQKVQIFWDLTRVKLDSGPEPRSGFYIAVVVDGGMGLLVGDAVKEAYARTRAGRPTIPQALILRREHVVGNRVFCTKARIGGRNREISIDCQANEDARLCFGIDSKRVLQIKRLRWKFRGNERIEVDGVPVQISWDVYNWLFENKPAVNDVNGNGNCNGGGDAVFMFRFETDPVAVTAEETEEAKNGVVLWQAKQPCGFVGWRKKMKRSFLRRGKPRSSSSSSMMSVSMSSASSACSSSVLEWASSADEAEYGGGFAGGPGCPGGGIGYSLVVYARRK
ncbi:PREDICTED: uncharacterized protein LOC104815002 [Tarenaya hassleriana]|uniref:uncharacterized protein LOC104815002 n=1 Tax=Tarenaya hassleriana TaxID=28532 RepID=UPI00053C0B6C|nr:PREDICTED: uncharacterized protein LOC104815002 [Tarenaya hassleriana]XP_010541584.1 PREDICTED: uncharacterized protein LOC104815002 [Tarenaya hassleriana]